MNQKGFLTIFLIILLLLVLGGSVYIFKAYLTKSSSVTLPLVSERPKPTLLPQPSPSSNGLSRYTISTKCEKKLPKTVTLPTGEIIVQSDFGYQITIPKNWIVEENCDNGGFRVSYAKEATGIYGPASYLTFMNPEDNKSNLSLDDWLKTKDLEFEIYGKIYETTKKSINPDGAKGVIFSAIDEPYKTAFIQLEDSFIRVNYSISPRDIASYPNSNFYEEHKNDLDKIISSFKFTN